MAWLRSQPKPTSSPDVPGMESKSCPNKINFCGRGYSFWAKVLIVVLVFVLICPIPYFVVTFRNGNTQVVDLGYARYRGQALRNGVRQYLGIRYAAPPVGNLRFAAPQDPLINRVVQNATWVSSIVAMPMDQY